MSNYVNLNNRLIPASQAHIPVTDRGFLYGDGVFDTMQAVNGKVFKLNRHLNRLQDAARTIGITIPAGDSLSLAIKRTLHKNQLKNASVRITVTRGSGGKRLLPDPASLPTILIVTKKQVPVPDTLYRTGLKTCLVSPRRNSGSPESRIKSLNYLPNILGKAEAEKNGCTEGIMLNEKGYIACGTVSNIFFIKDDLLITPPLTAGILPGITRKIILEEVAPALGLKAREKNIRPKELVEMAGAFVTNSLWGTLPLKSLDLKRFKRPNLLTIVLGFYQELVKKNGLK